MQARTKALVNLLEARLALPRGDRKRIALERAIYGLAFSSSARIVRLTYIRGTKNADKS